MDSKTRKILNKLWRGSSFKMNGKHWKTYKNNVYMKMEDRIYVDISSNK